MLEINESGHTVPVVFSSEIYELAPLLAKVYSYMCTAIGMYLDGAILTDLKSAVSRLSVDYSFTLVKYTINGVEKLQGFYMVIGDRVYRLYTNRDPHRSSLPSSGDALLDRFFPSIDFCTETDLYDAISGFISDSCSLTEVQLDELMDYLNRRTETVTTLEVPAISGDDPVPSDSSITEVVAPQSEGA